MSPGLTDLLAVDCHRLVLESRGPSDDLRGTRTISTALGPAPSKSGLVHEHLRPYEDPLLWLPDAVAWCHGAGQCASKPTRPADTLAVTSRDLTTRVASSSTTLRANR